MRTISAPAPASWLAVLLPVLTGALLVLAPSAYADESPAPAPSPSNPVTWGTGPTDNEVGTGRPNFSYDAKPGGTLRDAIDVVNRSDRALELKIYASDAFTTESGVLDLLPADQEPVDVGTWIGLDEEELTVPAGKTVTVPFTLTVPDNATPGDHTGGIVTSLVTGETDGQVSVDRRIGSRVMIRVAGDLRPELSVTDVQTSYGGTANPFSSGALHVTYTVTNTGNVRLAAHQTIGAAGPFGLLGQATRPADLPELLPGDSLTLDADLAGIWPTVRVDVEIALDPYASTGDVSAPPAIGGAGLWALPWGQVVLLLAVAALIWLVILLRRRRKAALQARVDAAVSQALEQARTSS